MSVQAYFSSLFDCGCDAEATNAQGRAFPLEDAIAGAIERLRVLRSVNGEVHLVGNGGSNGVIQHAYVDFVKAANIRARIHNDTTALTAYSNDLDYSVAWAKLLTLLMRTNDLLIAVSSSGESASILNAVDAARRRHAVIITLSGFEPTNRLRQLGDLNFYVPSMNYGHVELTHAALLHYITDEVARVG